MSYCVIAASAVFNSNSRIMVAALKFFLGQDEAADNESDDEGDEDEFKAVQPSKQEMYNANKKVSSTMLGNSTDRRTTQQ